MLPASFQGKVSKMTPPETQPAGPPAPRQSWILALLAEKELKLTRIINTPGPTVYLDSDGTVSRHDISIVAEAFGAKSGELDWNGNADLDKNGKINMIDVGIVARAFGITF